MAKAPPAKEENGKGPQNPEGQPTGQQSGPTLNVLAQYIKDFSFENPNSPNSLRARENSPNINIGINVTANGLSPTDYEVVLKLDAKAMEADGIDVAKYRKADVTVYSLRIERREMEAV